MTGFQLYCIWERTHEKSEMKRKSEKKNPVVDNYVFLSLSEKM